MAQIAYETKGFRQDYRRADPSTQRRIDAFIEKFAEETARGGVRLKALTHAVDRRMRTARIDRDWRAVLAHIDGEDHVLLRALPHDAAYAFAQSHRLDVSAVTGLPRLVELVDSLGAPPRDEVTAITPDPAGPLAHRSDDDLVIVGVPPAAVASLRALPDREAVMQLAELLATNDPLIEFAVEYSLDRFSSVDEVLAQVLALAGEDAASDGDGSGDSPDGDPLPPAGPRFDSDDLSGALGRSAAAEEFHSVDSTAELVAALRGDLADWQVFLHPLQRRAAYDLRTEGPARISGGAGTGKTVVLLHRAKALLERPQVDGFPPRILVTTYTEHLRGDLTHLLKRLIGQGRAGEVRIETVDGLARWLHDSMDGSSITTLSAADEAALWESVHRDAPTFGRSAEFLANEYRHVILAGGVRTLDDYLDVSRSGRGIRLARSERASLWPAFELFTARTRGSGCRTALQLTEDIAALLERAPADLFDHVLIDEAQDLHPAQWRLLRALVPVGPEDLFIVGDAFQRIYGNRSSLRSLGIETRGRSIRLRRNYRSTREIAAWALRVIGHDAVMDLDDHGADLGGYHSVRSGPMPILHSCADRAAELAAVVAIVRARIDSGYPRDHLAVAARTDEEVGELVAVLSSNGVEAAPIGPSGRAEGAVNVARMHRLKGLEFPGVIVTGLSAENVPRREAICPIEVDPAQHRADTDAERALVYVAATRARDRLDLTWHGPPSPLLPLLTPPEETTE